MAIPGRKLGDGIRGRIIKLLLGGWSLQRTADVCDVSRETVKRVKAEAKEVSIKKPRKPE